MQYSKEVEQRYYDKLRQMSGEERMKLGFAMCDFAMSLAKVSIQYQFPNITEQEQKAKTKEMYGTLIENQELINKMFLLDLWQKIQKA